MGDIRQRNGIYEHQVADKGSPEEWVRIAYSDTGAPLTIYQAGAADVSLTPDGSLLFAFGGHMITAPPAVAGTLVDALSKQVPQGAQTQVAAQVEQIQAQIATARAELADVNNQLQTAVSAAVGVPDAPVVP